MFYLTENSTIPTPLPKKDCQVVCCFSMPRSLYTVDATLWLLINLPTELMKAQADSNRDKADSLGFEKILLIIRTAEEMVYDLSGKVALVTGASSGIGKELALALAKHGCSVIAAARRLPLLHSLQEEVNSFSWDERGNLPRPGKLSILRVDVSADEKAIDAAVEEGWKMFGGIDILVNNAGVRGPVKSPLDWDENIWNGTMDTNLKGPWLMTKSVGRRMRAAKKPGSIINVTSTAGLERSLLPGALAYAVSKAGANHLTKVLALEMGKYNIRVNAIASGMFKTEITNDLFDKPWMPGVALKIVTVGRWGNINPDLTSLVVMLASDASSYVTGNVFVTDGGQSLPSVPVWSSL
ncbi:hypothetical protein R1flu_025000 [Riccia fluitans]|uniref:Uncharacterized protein n=1 Tax=Riccia fluitans TaxID=41844 RepID=A0ABD1XXF2_9MARC